MACHYASADLKSVIREYYTQSLTQKLTFNEWVRQNYSIYTLETLGIDPDYKGNISIEEEEIVTLPTREESWTSFERAESRASYAGGHVFDTQLIDNAKVKYNAGSRKTRSMSFELYAFTEAKLYAEPSGWKLFSRKTKEEKAMDTELKKLKKESDARIKEVTSKNEHERKKEDLKVRELKKISESDEKSRKNLKERHDKIEALKKKAVIAKQANTKQKAASPSLASKKTRKLLEWNNDDAYLVYQALFSPNYLKLDDLPRLQKIVKTVILDNEHIRSRFDSIKSAKESVTEVGILKLLNIFRTFPDHWKSGSKKMPKTSYKGSIEWGDVSTFTLPDCYDAFLAFNEICKGEMYKSLTGAEIRERKPTIFQRFKSVISTDKSTFIWDDSIVLAIQQKLTEKNPRISTELINPLAKFTKLLCKNYTIETMRSRIHSFIGANGHPPISDTGVVCLISMAVHHSTADQGGALAHYVNISKENNVAIMSKEETDSMCDYDLMRARDVYNTLKDAVRKGALPFDSRLSSSFAPSEAQKDEPMLEVNLARETMEEKETGSVETEVTEDEEGFLNAVNEITREALAKHTPFELTRQLTIIIPTIKVADASVEAWGINLVRDVVKVYTQFMLQFRIYKNK